MAALFCPIQKYDQGAVTALFTNSILLPVLDHHAGLTTDEHRTYTVNKEYRAGNSDCISRRDGEPPYSL